MSEACLRSLLRIIIHKINPESMPLKRSQQVSLPAFSELDQLLVIPEMYYKLLNTEDKVPAFYYQLPTLLFHRTQILLVMEKAGCSDTY